MSEETRALLDCTYAFPLAQEQVRNGGPYAQRAAEMASRLAKEAGTLPFLTMPYAWDLSLKLKGHAEFLRSFRHMLLLGIGGSALGARALQKAFAPGQDRPGHEGPWLWIADNLDEDAFAAMLDRLPPEETLVLVVSKSGGTLETAAQYLAVLPWLKKHLPATWQEHLFMVTDAQKGFLRDETDTHFLRSLPVPEYLGGRYSVLSAVGLVPALFLGINWAALLDGGCDLGRGLLEAASRLSGEGLAAHPAWKMATWAAFWAEKGKSQLINFCYEPQLASFGPWFCQLWAESLGKNGRGTMPLSAVGATDQHSLLQMFLQGPADKACLFLGNRTEGSGAVRLAEGQPEPWNWLSGRSLGEILGAEALATRMSLARAGMPLMSLELPEPSPWQAGRMIVLLEAVTLLTGWLLDINPLDQPAVEEGKRLARARLDAPGTADRERDALKAFDAHPRETLEF